MNKLRFNCSIHGYIKDDEIKIVTIKKIEYQRCLHCKREKDREYAKNYRNKNKQYYKNKNIEHYKLHPEKAMERQRRYRSKKKTPE